MSSKAGQQASAGAIASKAPVAADGDSPSQPLPNPTPNMPKIVSVGPGGFLRQGPGDQQAPIPPAPPRRLVPAKPSPEIADKTSLLDLSDKVCRWPMGHPGEADFHFCGDAGEPGLSLLRRTLRSRLSGAAAARRAPPPSAAAVWWSARTLRPAFSIKATRPLPPGRRAFVVASTQLALVRLSETGEWSNSRPHPTLAHRPRLHAVERPCPAGPAWRT